MARLHNGADAALPLCSVWNVAMELWGKLSEHLPALTAGAAGGLVRWLSLKESVRDGVISIIVGAVTSYYAGPLASAVFDPVLKNIILDETKRNNLSGFLVGCGGILVVGYVIDRWRLASKNRGGDNAP